MILVCLYVLLIYIRRLGLGAVSVGGSSGKTGLMFSEAVFRKTRFSKENARSKLKVNIVCEVDCSMNLVT